MEIWIADDITVRYIYIVQKSSFFALYFFALDGPIYWLEQDKNF